MVLVIVHSSQRSFHLCLPSLLVLHCCLGCLHCYLLVDALTPTVVLLVLALGGCFAAQVVVVRWMLCHHSWLRWMLCHHVWFAWANALPPCCCLGGYFVTTGRFRRMLCHRSSTLVDALPSWSCASSLLSIGFFGDGVSFCRFRSLGSLVRVVCLVCCPLLSFFFCLLWLRLRLFIGC